MGKHVFQSFRLHKISSDTTETIPRSSLALTKADYMLDLITAMDFSLDRAEQITA